MLAMPVALMLAKGRRAAASFLPAVAKLAIRNDVRTIIIADD
jgi:hypothetical protein